MNGIPFSIYRGGTSRALFFLEKYLPKNIADQDAFILKVMGSGHPLQIDGLGGGNPLTSKCAIIGPPSISEADIDYTFLYPSVTTKKVDRSGNCGNISSAVGPFAINEGIIQSYGNSASIIIHNTNTRTLIRTTFEIKNNRFYSKGDFSIDGLPGSGSRIKLDFLPHPEDTLLPTGMVKEKILIPDWQQEIEISVVNAGNLTVFCKMEDITSSRSPTQWQADKMLWKRMELVRSAACIHLGIAKSPEEAYEKSPAIPKIIAIGSKSNYRDLTGQLQSKKNHQFRILMAAMGVMHQSVAVTGAVAIGAASVLPGSIVNEIREETGPDIIIGHPSGLIALKASIKKEIYEWKLDTVSLNRTAREICRGVINEF